MKGKIRLGLKFVLAMLIILVSSTAIVFTFINRSQPTEVRALHSVYSPSEANTYSANFNGVVFSAEKVYMDSDNATQNLDSETSDKTFYNYENSAVYFKDFAYGDKSKYVIEDGSLVMMTNLKDASGNFYSQTNANLKEAIIISLGQYYNVYKSDGSYKEEGIALNIKDEETGEFNESTYFAQITALDVLSITHNGNNIKSEENFKDTVIDKRNIDTKEGYRFYDFMFVIDQKEGNEGYYEFKVRFTYQGLTYTETFGFYVLFQTSYTNTLQSNGNIYYATPTMLDKDNNQIKEMNFNIGVNGYKTIDDVDTLNYPIITYDYTRFKMTYTHTSNRKTTNYDVSFDGNGSLIVSSDNESISYQMTCYKDNSDTNIVEFMFTEKGSYTFDFEYIYVGYESPNTPVPELTFSGSKISKSLVIRGFELEYSKLGYTEAELKYYVVSRNQETNGSATFTNVDLVIPNGYNRENNSNGSQNIEAKKNDKLDFVYSYDKDSTLRLGTVIYPSSDKLADNSTTKDALLNNRKLIKIVDEGKATEIITTETITAEKITDFASYLLNTEGDYFKSDKTPLNDLSSIISTINTNHSFLSFISKDYYVKTNQASVWLEGNDSFDSAKSFYFFSKNPITANDLFTSKTENEKTTYSKSIEMLTNQTSFNKVGYYLVFVKVSDSYYQLFAFNYANDAISIKTIEEKTSAEDVDTIVSASGYTTKNVVISWDEPGVFEKAILATIRTSNVNTTDYSKFSAPQTIQNGQVVGNVADGSFTKFLVTLKNEGDSVSYKEFTIDKTPISGLKVFALSSDYDGANIVYTNTGIEVKNSITDSTATLVWDEKASGAKVSATYYRIPLIQTSSEVSGVEGSSSSGFYGITNKYEFGTPLGQFVFNKPDSNFEIAEESRLTEQGIYIFTLTDGAGNSCKYMFVIDRTPNYFKINGQFASHINVMDPSVINYNVGSHKIISLTDASLDPDKDWTKIISLATNSSSIIEQFTEIGYYSQSDNNIANIKSLFKTIGGTTYLTVANRNIVVFDQINNSSYTTTNTSGTLNYQESNSTSFKRRLYAISENNIYSATTNTQKLSSIISYVDVEINKDNSQAKVYYSDSPGLTITSLNSNYILATGSDKDVINDNTDKGLYGAQATSDNYVYFTWLIGTGTAYEVNKVSYKFYPLDTTNGSYGCYSEPESESTIIYENSTMKNGAEFSGNESEYGLFQIGKGGITSAGLYVFTREYKNELPSGSEDKKELNYYFIVDRNGVKESGIGTSIAITTMDAEISDFSAVSTNPEILNCEKYLDIPYSVFFQATKVPAILNIPYGKYFDKDENSLSDYPAGKLNVKVFYQNTESQFDGGNLTYLIYDSTATNIRSVKNTNGYITIDIKKYLKQLSDNGVYSELYNRMFDSDEVGTNWLSLPGRYVVVVEDSVKNVANVPHRFLIGFDIIKDTNGPQLDIKAGFGDSVSETIVEKSNDFHYKLSTNAETIQLTLPTYNIGDTDTNSEKASIDDKYLVVTKKVGNGVEKYVVNDRYGKDENEYTATLTINNAIKDNVITLKLNSSENDLSEKVIYTITVRYKLTDADSEDADSDYEKFMSAYRYYNKPSSNAEYNFVSTFEATYTIEIDRLAPTKTVNSLIQNEVENKNNFITNYGDTNNFFVATETSVGSSKVFMYRYNAYVGAEANDANKIYAFEVGKNWFESDDDRAEIRYKAFNASTPSLNVVTNKNSYSLLNFDENNNVSGLETNKYYEILEIDKAGNITQYVVRFNPNDKKAYSITFGDIEVPTSESSAVTIKTPPTSVSVNNAGEENDLFNVVKLTSSEQVLINEVTGFATDFDALSTSIKDKIFSSFGNYTLSVKNRNQELATTINYTPSEVKSLNTSGIFKKQADGTYIIDLLGANVTDNGFTNYPTKVEVEKDGILTTYVVQPNGTSWNFYIQTENTKIETTQIIPCDGKSYTVKLTDIDGKTSQIKFVTDGTQPHSILIKGANGNWGDVNYSLIDGTKYVFGDVKITYNQILYPNANININDVEYTISDLFEGTKESEYITVESVDESYLNVLIKNQIATKVVFTYESNETEKFTMIPSIGLIQLYQYQQNSTKEIDSEKNEDKNNVTTSNRYSGIHTLTWTLESTDYFDYELSMIVQNGEDVQQIEIDSTNNSLLLNPTYYGTGTYKFEIVVRNKDDSVIGNMVYAFGLEISTAKKYIVQDNFGVEVKPNSTMSYNSGTINLYVTNFELTEDNIVLIDDATIVEVETQTGTGYEFRVFKVTKDGKDEIFAFLYVEPTDNIVKDIKIKTGEEIVKSINLLNEFEYSVVNKNISISMSRALENGTYIKEDKIIVKLYYNSIDESNLVKVYSESEISKIEIQGSGTYFIVVEDLAGNRQKFATNLATPLEYFELTTLTDVAILMNDQALVENGYFNGEVTIKIVDPAQYQTMKVEASRNGIESNYTTHASYTFTEPGYYRVTLTGKHQSGEEIKKTIEFTILNQNEVFTSIDLSTLRSYTISNVTDMNGNDITDYAIQHGLRFDYSDLMDEESLNYTSGKLSFTVTYLVKDEIYPSREFSVSFSLNNEVPKIICDVARGESTTKGFTISFNPGVIYDQVGEVSLYINGEKIDINEYSSYGEMSISRTYKENGAGDYYIKLVNSSGTVLSSYKVTIKEPLNVWAIVVIVVVSVIVVSVTVAIIVIRHKMRIR